jgi:hypothetical protein
MASLVGIRPVPLGHVNSNCRHQKQEKKWSLKKENKGRLLGGFYFTCGDAEMDCENASVCPLHDGSLFFHSSVVTRGK